jgi:DNA primase
MAKLPRIDRTSIERLKALNPLVEILAESGIRVQKKGRHLFALCPFHKEKTPSFAVTAHLGLYHCFGCGASGDVIGFLVRYERMNFVEACEYLARRAGWSLRQILEGEVGAASPVRPW